MTSCTLKKCLCLKTDLENCLKGQSKLKFNLIRAPIDTVTWSDLLEKGDLLRRGDLHHPIKWLFIGVIKDLNIYITYSLIQVSPAMQTIHVIL